LPTGPGKAAMNWFSCAAFMAMMRWLVRIWKWLAVDPVSHFLPSGPLSLSLSPSWPCFPRCSPALSLSLSSVLSLSLSLFPLRSCTLSLSLSLSFRRSPGCLPSCPVNSTCSCFGAPLLSILVFYSYGYLLEDSYPSSVGVGRLRLSPPGFGTEVISISILPFLVDFDGGVGVPGPAGPRPFFLIGGPSGLGSRPNITPTS
jgi:hypothetical protein